jgi:hypothetical protein
MFENPSLVPTVLDALRAGDYVTLLETLDLDEREDFTMAVPPGSGMVPDSVTLVRYGASQAVLHLGGGESDVALTFHAHENEADAIECYRWKSGQLHDVAAQAFAAAHGPAGKVFMALKDSGALDQMLKEINGD